MDILYPTSEEGCRLEEGDTDDYHNCGCRLCTDLATDEHYLSDNDCPGCGTSLFQPYNPLASWSGPNVVSEFGELRCAKCGCVVKDDELSDFDV